MTEGFFNDDQGEALDAAIADHGKGRHLFALYIAGTAPQSIRAIVNTRRMCEEFLQDRHELEIIDICKYPAQAAAAQIIAAPTLVRIQPLPVKRFIGDMSETAGILAELGLGGGQTKLEGSHD